MMASAHRAGRDRQADRAMFLNRITKNMKQTEAGLPAVARYLRYAIGETLLIVLGVLIAIQVNNWNEERQRRAEQLLIIQDLREAIQIDERLIDFVISNFTRTIRIVDEIEKQARGVASHPDAASSWVRLVFWQTQASVVSSRYGNGGVEIDDPELSVALGGYMARLAQLESGHHSMILSAVQELRQLMNTYLIREYNDSTEQIEPDIDVDSFLADYQSDSDLQESIYRLYLLSRTLVSQYESLQQMRADLESEVDRKIRELEAG